MGYYLNLLSFSLISVGAVVFSSVGEKKAAAIGCDTYYRVTGEIAGCTDISTEKAQELWLKKYSVCLEQQLAEEISIYDRKLKIYSAQWDAEGSNSYKEFDNISLSDLDIQSISLSTTNSTATYRGYAEFCDRE